VTIRCNAKGTKHGLGGLLDSDVACGSGLLSVGLYKRDDGEAREYANMLARKQQVYFSKLAEQAKTPRSSGLLDSLTALDRLFSGTKAKTKISRATAIGAAVQSQIEEGRLPTISQEKQAGGELKSALEDNGVLSVSSQEARAALSEMKSAKDKLRRMNGKES
jgi:hypothetical protein